MKKFFRMASVIAIAFASLTYTSCTKDYSEEINANSKDIAALQGKHDSEINDLKGEISTLKSGLTSLEAAYKAADATLQSALQAGIDENSSAIAALKKVVEANSAAITAAEGRIAANETAIANLEATVATLATKQELATAKGELDAKIDAAVADLQKKIDAANAEIAAIKEDILAKAAALEVELNSIKALIAALRVDVDKNTGDIDALEAAFEAFKAEYGLHVADFNAFKESTQADLKALRDAFDGHVLDFNALNAAFGKHVVDFEAFLNVFKGHVDDFDALKAAFDGHVVDFDALKAAFDGHVVDFEALKAAFDGHVVDFEALKEAFGGHLDEFAALKAAFGEHVAEFELLQAAFNEHLTDYEAFKLAFNALKDAFDGHVEEFNAFKESVEASIADLYDVYAQLSNRLTSLVFIPDLYFAGIEATEYSFMYIYPQAYVYALDTDGKTMIDAEDELYVGTVEVPSPSEKTDIVLAAGMPMWTTYTYEDAQDEENPIHYFLGESAVAKYHLNPSTFSVDKAEWALYGADFRYITRAEELGWTPVFDSIKNVNGVAEVSYHINNPELLYACVDTVHNADNVFDGHRNRRLRHIQNGVVPVMNLVATLKDAGSEDVKTISSDYEAIAPSYYYIEALAFKQSNSYETIGRWCDVEPNNDKELYYDVWDAIENVPSVPVIYNQGDVDLAALINIHMFDQYETEFEISLAELNEKYDGKFKMTFDNISYIVGENVTSEDMYAIITKEGILTPAHVLTGPNPSTAPNGVGETKEGRSSVGRQPVVLVTLWHDDNIVLGEYFKIEYVDKITDKELKLPPLGRVPFICDTVNLATNWHQFSHLILEDLGESYQSFTAGYDIETDSHPDTVEVYVKDASGKYVSTIDGKKVRHIYGNVFYNEDAATDGVNNVLRWRTKPRGIGEGKTQTVYVHFKRGALENVWVALTVSVAERAHYLFGDKLANEWYSGVIHCDENEPNTVIMNVPVPIATLTETVNPEGIDVKGGDVTKYNRNLNSYLFGSKPSINLTEDSDPVYAEIKADTDIYDDVDADDIAPSVVYTFSKEQDDNVGGAKLTVSDDQLHLLADGVEIAWLEVDTLRYLRNETSKKLLNLWSYKETDPEKIFWANIDVAINYGWCQIPAGNDHFHVRFVRPLHIDPKSQGTPEESQVDGFNLPVVDFLTSVTDWNNQPVIMDSLDNKGKPTGNLIEAVIKTVNMYKYYGIHEIKINLEKAVRNNAVVGDPDKFVGLYAATPDVRLAIGTVDADDVFTAATLPIDADKAIKINITDFNSLKKYKINYKNDKAVVEAFTIKIPVSYEYFWGTMYSEFTIDVKKTKDTQSGI